MNWKRTARWSWFALPFLLLAVGLGGAAADHRHKPPVPPAPNFVARDCATLSAGQTCIYELTENMKLKGDKVVRRVSTASAMGKVGAGSRICPGPIPCTITVVATDKIDVATGKGPIEGTFDIVVNEVVMGVPTTDAPEQIVLKGTLKGQVDISPALLTGLPLGSIAGRWHAPGVGSGTFTGTLRFPFGVGGVSCPDSNPQDCVVLGPFFYLDALSPINIGLPFNVRSVGANEISLAQPTLLFEIDFN